MTNHSSTEEKKFKFDDYLSKQTQYHLTVTVVSIMLLLFGLSTFSYRIYQVTQKISNLSITYFVLGFIGDLLAISIGLVGSLLNVFWKLPNVKYPIVIILLISIVSYSIYSCVSSVFGYLFYDQVPTTNPFIITCITVLGMFHFLIFWTLFHLCWHTRTEDLKIINMPNSLTHDDNVQKK